MPASSPIHISGVDHKRASTLVATCLLSDGYHVRIQLHALYLVSLGRGDLHYRTQFSYSTVWGKDDQVGQMVSDADVEKWITRHVLKKGNPLSHAYSA